MNSKKVNFCKALQKKSLDRADQLILRGSTPNDWRSSFDFSSAEQLSNRDLTGEVTNLLSSLHSSLCSWHTCMQTASFICFFFYPDRTADTFLYLLLISRFVLRCDLLESQYQVVTEDIPPMRKPINHAVAPEQMQKTFFSLTKEGPPSNADDYKSMWNCYQLQTTMVNQLTRKSGSYLDYTQLLEAHCWSKMYTSTRHTLSSVFVNFSLSPHNTSELKYLL